MTLEAGDNRNTDSSFSSPLHLRGQRPEVRGRRETQPKQAHGSEEAVWSTRGSGPRCATCRLLTPSAHQGLARDRKSVPWGPIVGCQGDTPNV